MSHPVFDFQPRAPRLFGDSPGITYWLETETGSYTAGKHRGVDDRSRMHYYPSWVLEGAWSADSKFSLPVSNPAGGDRVAPRVRMKVLSPLNPLYEVCTRSSLERRHRFKFDPKLAPSDLRWVDPAFLGRVCPVDTPETDSIGLSGFLAQHAHIDEKGRILSPYREVRGAGDEMRLRYLTAGEEVDQWIGESDAGDNQKVLARTLEDDNGVFREHYEMRKACELDYVLSDPAQILGFSASLIPFIQHDDGARAMQGAKMMQHALPLMEPDIPLVTTGFEQRVVEAARLTRHLIQAKMTGKVTQLSQEMIVISGEDGTEETVQLGPFPMRDGAHTGMCLTPRVAEGDCVNAVDLVADGPGMSHGELALGKNLLVAYLPYGHDFEDGIIISESAARKLTTPHVFVVEGMGKPVHNLSAGKLKEGLVKEGETVYAGERVAELAPDLTYDITERLREYLRATYGPQYGRRIGSDRLRLLKELLGVSESLSVPVDVVEGRVIRASQQIVFERGKPENKVEVWIYEEKPAKIGDKLAGRHGNKGVITQILPDEEMPYFHVGKQKHRVEAILNPMGVISRMNLGQLLETHWGWVRKQGIPGYEDIGRPFSNPKINDLRALLRRTGLDSSGKVELCDPRRGGEPFDNRVVVGYQYFLRLGHLADEKWHARGEKGPNNLITQQPSHGKRRGGGQRIGEMEVWALLAHCADHTLYEFFGPASDLKAPRRLRFGDGLPQHYAQPETLRAFRHLARAALWSLELPDSNTPKEARIHLMSEDEIRYNSGQVTSPSRSVTEQGGLYSWADYGETLKERRERSGHIDLAEPCFHPFYIERVIDEIVRAARNRGAKLSRTKLLKIWKCSDVHNGDTGTRALVRILKDYDADEENWRRYLITALPVPPPAYRPQPPRSVPGVDCHLLAAGELTYGSVRRQPLSLLYQQVCSANYVAKVLKESGQELAHALANIQKGKLSPGMALERTIQRLAMASQSSDWMSTADCQGLGAKLYPLAYSRLQRVVQRLFYKIKYEIDGKTGMLRGQLQGKRINRSGRAVIVPAPELALNECYVPLEVMVELLKGELDPAGTLLSQIRRGDSQAYEDANQAVENLVNEKTVKVLLNRQPTLHKYNILAFTPKVWHHKVIGIPPLICGMYAADFDGDQMAIYLPASRESQREAAEVMDPLKNIVSIASGKLLLHLVQDLVLGIYYLTCPGGDAAVCEWKSRQTARLAKVLRVENSRLTNVTKEVLEQLISDYTRQHSEDPATLISGLKELTSIALDASSRSGISFGLFDIRPVTPTTRKRWLGMLGSGGESDLDELKRELADTLRGDTNNPLATIYLSGARGSWDQMLQMIAFRGKAKDENGQDIDAPAVLANLREGLSPFQYFLGLHMTRRAMVEKKINVAKGGTITRELAESCYGMKIAGHDCGTTEGFSIPIRKAVGRYLSSDGRLVDNALAAQLRSEKIDMIEVRSPVTCVRDEPHSVCQKCYGAKPGSQESWEEGTRIGIMAAQSIGERGTQIAMKVFQQPGAEQPDLDTVKESLLSARAMDGVRWCHDILKLDLFDKMDPRHLEVVLKARVTPGGIRSTKQVAGDIVGRGFLSAACYRGAVRVLAQAAEEDSSDRMTDPKALLLVARRQQR